MFFSSRKKPPSEETVPKSRYDNVVLAHDVLLEGHTALTQEVGRLQAQVADLTSQYTALGAGGARVRSLALRAIKLLQRVDTTRTGGAAFKQEIDVLVGEARSAGLVEEKGVNDAASSA